MTAVLRKDIAPDIARAALPDRAATVITALIAAAVGLIFLSGCSQFDIRKNIPWLEKEDDKYGEPSKVTALWSDAVLNEAGKKSTRGFGGRLYFYGKDPHESIRVKGALVIYGFDERDRKADNVVPDKKFVFTVDQLQKHCSVNEVGPSYSIWIPWDDVGGMRKEISLIARFSSEKGGLVVSEQTKVALPGNAAAEKPAASDLPALFQNIPGLKPATSNPSQQFPGLQTNYEQPLSSNSPECTNPPGSMAPAPSPRSTVTIPLPSTPLSWLRQNATNEDLAATTPVDQNSPQAAATRTGAVGGIGTRGAAAAAPPSSQSNFEARAAAPAASAPANPPAINLPQGINPPPWNPGTQARANPAPSPSPSFGAAPVGWNAAAPWNSAAFGGLPTNSQGFAANPMATSMPAQGLPPSQNMPAMQPAGSGSWNNPAAFSAPAQTLMAPAAPTPKSSF